VPEGDEGSTQLLSFTLTRDNGLAASTVDWAASGLDARRGRPLPSGTVSFAVGELTKTITVPIVGDRSIEPDETLTVTLSNPGANLHLGTTTASTVVLDDDSLVSISANAVQVLEGDTGTQTQVSFTVSRADGSAASSVDWSVSGLPAADFGGTLPAGTIHFAVGETSRVITVAFAGDRIVEPDAVLTATLSNPQGNLRLGDAVASTNIINDDVGFSLTATPSASSKAPTAPGGPDLPRHPLETFGQEADISWRFVRWVSAPPTPTTSSAVRTPWAATMACPAAASISAPRDLPDRHRSRQGRRPAGIRRDLRHRAGQPPPACRSSTVRPTATSTTTRPCSMSPPSPCPPSKATAPAGVRPSVTRSGDLSQRGAIGYSISGYGESPTTPDDFAPGQALTGTVSFAAGESSKIV
jgi:hypothetical protein